MLKFFIIKAKERKLLMTYVLFEAILIANLLYFFEKLPVHAVLIAFIFNLMLNYFLSLPIFNISRYFYRFRNKKYILIPLIISSALVYATLLQGIFLLQISAGNGNDSAAMIQVLTEAHWQLFGQITRYILITGFSFMMIYLEKFESEKELTLQLRDEIKHAELETLKYQLNPHFLFNSLNSINSLINDSKEKSREMLVLLSDYLRYTLSLQDKTFVEILEEIQHIERYFEIEKNRFGDRLNYRIMNHVKPESKIPVLLLQALIENMIKHGLAKMRTECNMEILFRSENEMIYIELKNDIPGGFGNGYLERGVGLENVEKRLKTHFKNYIFEYKIEDQKFCVILSYPEIL